MFDIECHEYECSRNVVASVRKAVLEMMRSLMAGLTREGKRGGEGERERERAGAVWRHTAGTC